MHKEYLLFFILYLYLFLPLFQHIFRQKCHTDINNYNVVQYNPFIINYCAIEDVPNEIDFTVIWDKSYGCKLICISVSL
jgi:riboflavin transporter FmnP